jgi:D-alanyl-D-alanine carboxypeptidase (penicillin-binding protein 5/6)
MLKGLMLSSGNDAAVAIAEHIGGSVNGFAGMMNARAKEIGANHTHFVNPHGLPDEAHYTTAYDLALIAREAMENDVFRRIVSTKQASIPWEGRTYKRVLKNKNALLSSYEGATGIKTGFTSKAGRCLVFGAMREEMEIVGSVLFCAEWFDEAARLMDVCFDQYDMSHMLGPLESAGEIPVVGGQKKSVSMCLTQELQLPLAQGENAQVVLEVPFSVQAPVYPGMPLGIARLVLDGQVLGESRIVADERVDVTGIGYNISRVIAGWMLLNRQ